MICAIPTAMLALTHSNLPMVYWEFFKLSKPSRFGYAPAALEPAL
jgi:hypothetical protein